MSFLIAARSEAEAVRQYLESLRGAIAAFAENVIFSYSQPHPKTRVRTLTSARDEVVMLQDAGGEVRLTLEVRLAFRTVVIPDRPRRWTVETTTYIYHLEAPAIPVRELVGYHWHPDVGVSFPHIHMLAAGAKGRHIHVSAPHSTIKDPIVTAMRDFRVAPREAHRDNWAALLQSADETLQASMRWAMSARSA